MKRNILIVFTAILCWVRAEAQQWTNYAAMGNDVKSIVVVAPSDIWFATQDGGANNYTGGMECKTYCGGSNNARGGYAAAALDVQGNKWFAGGIDLDSYNGAQWTNNPMPIAISGTITCLAIDGLGNKWLGTKNRGLFKFDGTNWTNYRSSSSPLLNDTINCLAVDAQNKVWIGTKTGLSTFNGTTWSSYQTVHGLPHNEILSLLPDAPSTIWVGTRGGASKYNGSVFTNYTTTNSGLANNEVLALAQNSQGAVWMGTRSGISVLQGGNWSQYNRSNTTLKCDTIQALAIETTGKVWIGTANGLAVLNNGTITHYRSGELGLADNSVLDLAEDKLHRKWIATHKGISRYDSTTGWKLYDTANSQLKHNAIFRIAVGKQNNIWVSYSQNLGVSCFNGSTWTHYTHANSGLCSDKILRIVAENEDNIWFATDSGASRYNATTGVWTCFSQTGTGINIDWVHDLAFDPSQNTVWFATILNGLIKNQGGNWTQYTTANSGILYDAVVAVAVQKGVVWATHHLGLSRYDGTSWTGFTTLAGTLPDNIRGYTEVDQQNRLWMTALTGVYVWNDTLWTNYTNANTNGGLASDYISRILIDHKNDRWIGHNGSGISVMSDKLPTAVPELTTSESLLLYPNPVQNELHFVSTELKGQLRIYDVTGRCVLMKIFSATHHTVSVAALVPGVYVFRIGNVSGRFIKQ